MRGSFSGAARAVLVLAALVLAGCGPSEPEGADRPVATQAKAQRYVYSASEDLGGQYVAAVPVQRLNWRLKHIAIAAPEGFQTWAAQGRPAAKAPVVFVFEDTQAQGVTSAGIPRTLTIVAAAYDISDKDVRITAISGGLGEIGFVGSRKVDGLFGQLKIGPEAFDDLTLQTKTGSR